MIKTDKYMETLRTATIEDFKIGTTLVNAYGGWEFTIYNKYDDGIWEARGALGQGDRVIFEDDAKHWKVK